MLTLEISKILLYFYFYLFRFLFISTFIYFPFFNLFQFFLNLAILISLLNSASSMDPEFALGVYSRIDEYFHPAHLQFKYDELETSQHWDSRPDVPLFQYLIYQNVGAIYHKRGNYLLYT